MELLLSWPGIEINAQDDQVLSLNMITIVVLGTILIKIATYSDDLVSGLYSTASCLLERRGQGG